MAKSQLFSAPMQWIYTPRRRVPGAPRLRRRGGVHHRRRGSSRRGGTIVDVLRGRPLAHRQAVRLGPSPASGGWRCESGATIVPVAIHGSSKVRNWKRLQFPKVTILYGDPIRWEQIDEPTREQQQAVAERDLHRDPGALRRARRGRPPRRGGAAARAAPRVILRPGVLAGVRVAAAGEVAARMVELGAEPADDELDVLVFDGAAVHGMPAVLDEAWDAIRAALRDDLLIVLIAPPPGDAHAEAARAGLENMARTLSIEWARRGIRPVAIAPGHDDEPGRDRRARRLPGLPGRRLLLRLPLRPGRGLGRTRRRRPRAAAPGTNSAASAPTASTAAPTQIALVIPSVYACGDAYEPLDANTVASTATPSTPPSSRIALVAPDACPASSGRTAPSTALAAGANTSAMPTPAIDERDDRGRRRAPTGSRPTPASRSRSPAAPGRSPSAGATRCGPRAGRRSARRASASRSTAASAARPRAASSPARPGRTGPAGRSSRRRRRTSPARRR